MGAKSAELDAEPLMLNRHLLAYLPVYLAQALVGFGSVVVFTRLLSPDAYGQYMLVLTGSALISTLIFTWLDAAVARYHARAAARGRLGGHLFTALTLFAMIALPVFIIGAVALLLLDLGPSLKTACAYALAYVLLRAGVMIALETRRAAGEAWRYSLLETFSLAGGFAFGAALTLLTDLGSAGPLAGLALASAMALVFDLPALARKARKDRAHRARVTAFFAYGGPIAFSLIFEQLLTSGDRFLIAAYLGEAATGAYSAGYALADRSLSIIFLWLGMTTGPLLIAALEHEGRSAAQKVARQTGALMGAIGFPAAAGLALVSPDLARLMIGEELAATAATVVPLIALSGLMNGVMTHYFHTAYTLGRRTGSMAFIMTGSAVLNLVLNAALIPLLGLHGAAWATVAAYGVAMIACILHGRTIFAMPIPVREWSKAALATAGMSAGVVLSPAMGPVVLDLMVQIGAGVGVYAIIMLTFDGLGARSWLVEKLADRLARRAAA